jgi:hypothetical protein
MLPEQIRANAFYSHTDEYAWQRSYIADTVEALANHGYAILGGEVWIVENGRILAAPPLRSGENSVIGWDTKEKEEAETWDQFVLRTAKETLAVIESLDAEEEVMPEVRNKVYYNLTFTNEQEYAELRVA